MEKQRAPISRPSSIKDIARLAHVSHSTVSRALKSSSLIAPETAARVKRIAREVGYRPSAVARGLVTRRTMMIGVVVTAVSDPFISEVVGGIEDTARRAGYSVYLAESGADPERETGVVRSFAERRVDGIVVTASRVGALYTPLLEEMGVPIVLVNNQHPGEFVHSVIIENVEGSRLVTDYLLGLGHRRIAYLADRFGYQSNTERFAGYREALEQRGVPFLPELLAEGDGKAEGGLAATEELLSRPEPPTAIFCYNDMTAMGALRAAYKRGVRVPLDLSITGFDDLAISSFFCPPLTTVRQPMRQMGLLAMETLLALLANRGAGVTLRVPAELVVRESTAPPAAHR
jgi:DNA-binding LacI/PurR family transcriptional regulator